MQAFLFVKAAAGEAMNVAEAIEKVKRVKEVYSITGRFDILARIEAPNVRELGKLVVSKIQPVHGVLMTETAIVARP